MKDFRTKTETSRTRLRSPEGTEILWHEFWKLQEARPNVPGVRARVTLARPEPGHRQFVAETGGGHHFLMDDASGGTGPKPVELVAAALAGCTASDVVTILRDRKHQRISSYEVRVEADQAERPPQVFLAVRVHHVLTGTGLDPALVREAIELSEANNSAVAAMVGETAVITTTFEIVDENEPAAAGGLASSAIPGAPMSRTG